MEADEVFAKVDTNGDGLLSLDELSAYLAGGLTRSLSYVSQSVSRKGSVSHSRSLAPASQVAPYAGLM